MFLCRAPFTRERDRGADGRDGVVVEMRVRRKYTGLLNGYVLRTAL